MSNIIVLPRIEIDNPFGALATALEKEIIPFVKTLTENKDKIATLSDKELTDYVPILKQFAPDLLTQDGKINWNKVDEYAKSNDPFKQQIAEHLTTARKMREEYADFPIGVKVGRLDEYLTATDPQRLKKHFVINRVVEKFNEYIDKANLSEEDKLLLRAHALELAEKAVENPAYFTAFLKLFEQKQQGATQQSSGASSWKLDLDSQGGWKIDLDGQRKAGIRLEAPQLTVPQITPPKIPAVGGGTKQKRVVGHVARHGQAVKQVKQPKQDKNSQQTTNQKPEAFWRDGVLWVKGKDGKYYPKEAPLIEQDIDPLTAMLGGFISRFLPKAGGFVSRFIGRRGAKNVERVVEKEAPKVAEQVAEKEAPRGTKQTSKYDEKRKQVAGRIKEQMERGKGRWEFVQSPKQVNPDEVREAIKEAWKRNRRIAEEERKKKLPVLASKETRWEFANAKPPAIVFREGRMTDYIPPQFERVPVSELKELIRQRKLPTPAPKETRWEFAERKLPAVKGKTTIAPKFKETPYKETVAQQGFKVSQKLEEFLKRMQPKTETKTKEVVLSPIKKLENLVKEIPEEAKNDPEIRRRFVEIARDLKKISSEAPFRDVSDDLRVLDAKVDELKALLKDRYSKTTTEINKTLLKKKSSKKKSSE